MKWIMITFFAISITGLFAQNAEKQTLERGDFMNFEIINKQAKIIHAYVKGPKKGGGYFSYGLNLVPFVKRKERWPVGTKLYAVRASGARKLLCEFTADDEGELVNVNRRK